MQDIPNLYHGILSDAIWNGLQYGNERHVLLVLGMEGPSSIHSLKNKIDASKLDPRGISTEYSHRYYDEQIRRAVKNLKEKGFIRTVGPQTKSRGEAVDLTFHGLFWYFKYAGEKSGISERIKDAFNRCVKWEKQRGKLRNRELCQKTSQELIPFFRKWNNIVSNFPEGVLRGAIIKTIDSFFVGGKRLAQVRLLDIQNEIFWQWADNAVGLFRPREKGTSPKKNLDVAKYLSAEDAELLREAYIAFLINEDLNFLSNLGDEDVKERLLNLKSVTEIAFFEGYKQPVTTLFSKEGLKRYFPKYSGIEYYFTGMFVNNLLWERKPIDNYYYEI